MMKVGHCEPAGKLFQEYQQQNIEEERQGRRCCEWIAVCCCFLVAFIVFSASLAVIQPSDGFLRGPTISSLAPSVTSRPTPMRPTNKATKDSTPEPTNKPTKEPTPKPTHESTNKPTKEPTHSPIKPGFCGEFGESDEEIRARLLADHMLLFVGSSNGPSLHYLDTKNPINCLPENAFGLFQGAQFTNVYEFYIASDFYKVHPNAFSNDVSFISGVSSISFHGFRIESLPAGIFQNFINVFSMNLDHSDFIALNENIIGSMPRLYYLWMNNLKQLREFPKFLGFAPNVGYISLTHATNLSMVDFTFSIPSDRMFNVAFKNGIIPILNELGRNGLASALNIPPSSIFIS